MRASANGKRMRFMRPASTSMLKLSKISLMLQVLGLRHSHSAPSDERWRKEVEVAVVTRRTVATNSEKVAQAVEEYLN